MQRINAIIKDYMILYRYFDISSDDFNILVKLALNRSYKPIEFKKELEKEIKRYIKNKMHNSTYTYKVMTNYINSNLNYVNDYDSAQKEIYKLIEFFNKIEFFPDRAIIAMLIRNNLILKSILEILSKNKSEKGYILTYILDIYDSEINETNAISSDIKEQIFDESVLTIEEERALGYRILKGDTEAQKELILKNTKFVAKIAKKYATNWEDYEDILQDGFEGLCIAAAKFDVTKNIRFDCYAYYWIKSKILFAKRNTLEDVKLPNDIYWKKIKFHRDLSEFVSSLGRFPTTTEIADALGMTEKEVEKLLILEKGVKSFNDFISAEDDEEFGNTIESNGKSLDELMIESHLGEEIIQILDSSNLTETEREVISSLYGINVYKKLSYQDLALKYGMSIDRIKHIRNSALNKIRKNNIQQLSVYANDPDRIVKKYTKH